ncbi:MAG: response regulator [Dehalococcoidia bacterium]|nr:response regulator [Dehalococcoidia bacterium]
MLEAISQGRVAVFDDDIKFIRLVERILRGVNLDIQPITTPDIDEAARVVSCTGCRAALIDLYMYGDLRGLRLVEMLRQDPATSELTLIMTSAAHRELGRRVGFLVEHHCGVLLKPFSIDELLSRIDVPRTIAKVGVPTMPAPLPARAWRGA